MTTTTALAPVTLTVNGKDFIVHPPSLNMGNNVGAAYYCYTSTRNGKKFGPIRTAAETGGAKTVGRQLAVAARAYYGPEVVDALLAEKIAKAIENTTATIAAIDAAERYADSSRAFHTERLVALQAAQAKLAQ